MHQQIITKEIDMEKYLEYKQWWLQYGFSWGDGYNRPPEDQFEEHINEMTTYELMETLANSGD
jgi:hypothetical protein